MPASGVSTATCGADAYAARLRTAAALPAATAKAYLYSVANEAQSRLKFTHPTYGERKDDALNINGLDASTTHSSSVTTSETATGGSQAVTTAQGFGLRGWPPKEQKYTQFVLPEPYKMRDTLQRPWARLGLSSWLWDDDEAKRI